MTPKPTDPKDAAWQAATHQMRQASAGVDWSGVDWSKLTGKDVGVRFGPVMSEAEFAEYRRRSSNPVHVIKADPSAGNEKKN